jgi:pyruvate,water dikinase
VERGSLLSHSAIVAREFGIPAIVGIPGLMQWARDGEAVRMDGTTGVVERVDVPANASETANSQLHDPDGVDQPAIAGHE